MECLRRQRCRPRPPVLSPVQAQRAVCVCGCVVGLGLYGVSALGVRDISVCARLRAGACESVRGCGCLLTQMFHVLFPGVCACVRGGVLLYCCMCVGFALCIIIGGFGYV